ncbi:hypothetical protein HZH66_004071 [Vespula vulgaris]|uniref:Uncharacterized protein n=1 Tax=Vespula vulgaris TaxID=7454 RepID=A0A834NCN5_VESVU|nr:hypothetical protein HZH66_004071 [Vespula vulgaris]
MKEEDEKEEEKEEKPFGVSNVLPGLAPALMSDDKGFQSNTFCITGPEPPPPLPPPTAVAPQQQQQQLRLRAPRMSRIHANSVRAVLVKGSFRLLELSRIPYKLSLPPIIFLDLNSV